jgi:predicted nucleotidyltransferase
MKDLEKFVLDVAQLFRADLGAVLVEAYKLGSLAHGGFSDIYSDIDVGLVLSCPKPPLQMSELIAGAKALHSEYGRKLSVFWGNPDFDWGRLPVIDRLDLLDHGVALLYGIKPSLRRPTKDEIHREQLQSIERSWKPRLPELSGLTSLEPKDRKPYIRAILYAARLIYTWDKLVVGSNDSAVDYLHQVRPDGLDLRPIEMALACRRGECSAEDVMRVGADLNRQCESALRYVLGRP